MTVPTDLEERLRDIAKRMSIAASWAGSALHSRRIQGISEELLELIGDKPADTNTSTPPADTPPAGAVGGSAPATPTSVPGGKPPTTL